MSKQHVHTMQTFPTCVDIPNPDFNSSVTHKQEFNTKEVNRQEVIHAAEDVK